MKKRTTKKGFTLIELIVVIAILGILAAVVIPRFAGTTTNARTRANEANISTLTSAATIAVAEHGNPSAEVTWTSTVNGTTPHLRDNYVQTWPTPPTGFGAYTVTISTAGAVSVTQ